MMQLATELSNTFKEQEQLLDAKEREIRLAYVKGQMELCSLRAQVWMMKVAFHHDPKEALKIAENHIRLYQECLDAQNDLLRGQ